MKILSDLLNMGGIKYLVFIVIWPLLVFPAISHANFERALEIYRSGNFSQAKEAFEALAAIGDRPSLFNLGVMQYRGEAGEKDPVKAYVLMKIANEGDIDESFKKVSASIFKKLTDEQKQDVEKTYNELNKKYNIDNIIGNIFPKPLDDADCAPEIIPIKRVVPLYPKSENRAGRMGLTYTEYTISPEGYPRDLIAVNSTNKVFLKTSIKAIKKFIYEPPPEKTPIYGHRNVFIYQLEQGAGNSTNSKNKAIVRELKELENAAIEGDTIAQYKYAFRLNAFRYFKSYLKNVDLQYRRANEWFTKSAKSGLMNSQFEIGRNMIEGRGCEVDKVNGYKWVKAAAVGGYSPAQKMLAQSALTVEEMSERKSLAAVSWLRNASLSGDFPAKVLLAWELSTSSVKDIRNGNEALSLLESESDKYFDKIRILETKAAAYAEIGNFKKAIKYQKKASDIAETSEWTIPLITERLGLYQHNEPYRGSYY